jgi:hypothetical protein
MLANVIEGTLGAVDVPACRLRGTAVDAVPVKLTDAGLPTALLATFNAAENVPAVEDVKVTVIVQFAPMARVDAQVVPDTVKSAGVVPPMEVPLIFTTDEPVLVKVAVCEPPDGTSVLMLSAGLNDTNVCAPGRSPIKLALSMADIGVTTGPAIPTR